MERPQIDHLDARRHLFRMRFDGDVKHTETGERLNVFDPHFETVEELDLSGVYEHYKSTADDPKLYYVYEVKRRIDSGECLVVYIPLYETENQDVAVRPLSNFTGTVEVDGEEVSRFRFINQDL